MRFADAFGVRPGLTALVGGGGKTTLLYRLAEELRGCGTVIVCTSTHILRPDRLPLLTDADRARTAAELAARGVICLGSACENGKLSAPSLPFSVLTELADYVLVEADGSKRLPMKAHLPHEPVIPENARLTVTVVGASGFGRPISEVCHRAGQFAALAGTAVGQPVTPEALARVLRAEGYGDLIYVNQVETVERLAAARAVAALTDCPVFAGSLWKEELTCLS